MSVLVADNIGLIKLVNTIESKTINEFYNADKQSEILFMNHYKNKKWLITCNKNNIVTLFFATHNQEKNEYTFESKHSIQYESSQESHAIGFSIYPNSGYLIIVQSNGQIYRLDLNFAEGFAINQLFQLPIPKITKVKKVQKSLTQILVLSKGTNPQIWDFEENKLVWKAKNVKNDYLDLQVPIYDLDAAFEAKTKEFFVCTAFQKIRKYNFSNENSKPVKDIEIKAEKSPFNNIIISNCGQYLFMSNYLGCIYKLNKTKLTILQKFKGSLGVITQIILNKSEDTLFSIGLDRYLRVYNLQENESQQIYLKQKLTAIMQFDIKQDPVQPNPKEKTKSVIKHNYYTKEELQYTKKDAKQFERKSFSIYSKGKTVDKAEKLNEGEEKIVKKQKKK